MKILVRLPNWLGDMVMAVGFMRGLAEAFPGAGISVIVKKGIHELMEAFPATEHQFVFDKNQYSGPLGAYKFGQEIKAQQRFDLFFCLPDSLSSAIMGMGTGADKRIGFKKEIRQVFLTHAYQRPEGMHRVDEYIALLEYFTGQKVQNKSVRLENHSGKEDHVVVNINSEASSRRLTPEKAAELLALLRSSINEKIILIGAPKEKEFVEGVISRLPDQTNIESMAGKTSLSQLVQLLSSARAMLTTDSGPAHLSNALGTHTVVLFGAGNEANTAPYNAGNRSIIRLGQLTCEPCTKNVCVRYGIPQCLERLDSMAIVSTLKKAMHG